MSSRHLLRYALLGLLGAVIWFGCDTKKDGRLASRSVARDLSLLGTEIERIVEWREEWISLTDDEKALCSALATTDSRDGRDLVDWAVESIARASASSAEIEAQIDKVRAEALVRSLPRFLAGYEHHIQQGSGAPALSNNSIALLAEYGVDRVQYREAQICKGFKWAKTQVADTIAFEMALSSLMSLSSETLQWFGVDGSRLHQRDENRTREYRDALRQRIEEDASPPHDSLKWVVQQHQKIHYLKAKLRSERANSLLDQKEAIRRHIEFLGYRSSGSEDIFILLKQLAHIGRITTHLYGATDQTYHCSNENVQLSTIESDQSALCVARFETGEGELYPEVQLRSPTESSHTLTGVLPPSLVSVQYVDGVWRASRTVDASLQVAIPLSSSSRIYKHQIFDFDYRAYGVEARYNGSPMTIHARALHGAEMTFDRAALSEFLDEWGMPSYLSLVSPEVRWAKDGGDDQLVVEAQFSFPGLSTSVRGPNVVIPITGVTPEELRGRIQNATQTSTAHIVGRVNEQLHNIRGRSEIRLPGLSDQFQDHSRAHSVKIIQHSPLRLQLASTIRKYPSILTYHDLHVDAASLVFTNSRFGKGSAHAALIEATGPRFDSGLSEEAVDVIEEKTNVEIALVGLMKQTANPEGAPFSVGWAYDVVQRYRATSAPGTAEDNSLPAAKHLYAKQYVRRAIHRELEREINSELHSVSLSQWERALRAVHAVYRSLSFEYRGDIEPVLEAELEESSEHLADIIYAADSKVDDTALSDSIASLKTAIDRTLTTEMRRLFSQEHIAQCSPLFLGIDSTRACGTWSRSRNSVNMTIGRFQSNVAAMLYQSAGDEIQGRQKRLRAALDSTRDRILRALEEQWNEDVDSILALANDSLGVESGIATELDGVLYPFERFLLAAPADSSVEDEASAEHGIQDRVLSTLFRYCARPFRQCSITDEGLSEKEVEELSGQVAYAILPVVRRSVDRALYDDVGLPGPLHGLVIQATKEVNAELDKVTCSGFNKHLTCRAASALENLAAAEREFLQLLKSRHCSLISQGTEKNCNSNGREVPGLETTVFRGAHVSVNDAGITSIDLDIAPTAQLGVGWGKTLTIRADSTIGTGAQEKLRSYFESVNGITDAIGSLAENSGITRVFGDRILRSDSLRSVCHNINAAVEADVNCSTLAGIYERGHHVIPERIAQITSDARKKFREGVSDALNIIPDTTSARIDSVRAAIESIDVNLEKKARDSILVRVREHVGEFASAIDLSKDSVDSIVSTTIREIEDHNRKIKDQLVVSLDSLDESLSAGSLEQEVRSRLDAHALKAKDEFKRHVEEQLAGAISESGADTAAAKAFRYYNAVAAEVERAMPRASWAIRVRPCVDPDSKEVRLESPSMCQESGGIPVESLQSLEEEFDQEATRVRKAIQDRWRRQVDMLEVCPGVGNDTSPGNQACVKVSELRENPEEVLEDAARHAFRSEIAEAEIALERVKGKLDGIEEAALDTLQGIKREVDNFCDKLRGATPESILGLPVEVSLDEHCPPRSAQVRGSFDLGGITFQVMSGLKYVFEEDSPRFEIEWDRLRTEPRLEDYLRAELSRRFDGLTIQHLAIDGRGLVANVEYQPGAFPWPIVAEINVASLDEIDIQADLDSQMVRVLCYEADQFFQSNDMAFGPISELDFVEKTCTNTRGRRMELNPVTFDFDVEGFSGVEFTIIIDSRDGVIIHPPDLSAESVLANILAEELSAFGLYPDAPEFYSLENGLTLFLVANVELPLLEGSGLNLETKLAIGSEGLKFRGPIEVTVPGWYDGPMVSFGNLGMSVDFEEKMVGFHGAVTLTPGEAFQYAIRVNGTGEFGIEDLRFETRGDVYAATILNLGHRRTTIDAEERLYEMYAETGPVLKDLVQVKGTMRVQDKRPAPFFLFDGDGSLFGADIAKATVTLDRDLSGEFDARLDTPLDEQRFSIVVGEQFSDAQGQATVNLNLEIVEGEIAIAAGTRNVSVSGNVEVENFKAGLDFSLSSLDELTPERILEEILVLKLDLGIPSSFNISPGLRDGNGTGGGDDGRGGVDGGGKPAPNPPRNLGDWTLAWRTISKPYCKTSIFGVCIDRGTRPVPSWASGSAEGVFQKCGTHVDKKFGELGSIAGVGFFKADGNNAIAAIPGKVCIVWDDRAVWGGEGPYYRNQNEFSSREDEFSFAVFSHHDFGGGKNVAVLQRSSSDLRAVLAGEHIGVNRQIAGSSAEIIVSSESEDSEFAQALANLSAFELINQRGSPKLHKVDESTYCIEHKGKEYITGFHEQLRLVRVVEAQSGAHDTCGALQYFPGLEQSLKSVSSSPSPRLGSPATALLIRSDGEPNTLFVMENDRTSAQGKVHYLSGGGKTNTQGSLHLYPKEASLGGLSSFSGSSFSAAWGVVMSDQDAAGPFDLLVHLGDTTRIGVIDQETENLYFVREHFTCDDGAPVRFESDWGTINSYWKGKDTLTPPKDSPQYPDDKLRFMKILVRDTWHKEWNANPIGPMAEEVCISR